MLDQCLRPAPDSTVRLSSAFGYPGPVCRFLEVSRPRRYSRTGISTLVSERFEFNSSRWGISLYELGLRGMIVRDREIWLFLHSRQAANQDPVTKEHEPSDDARSRPDDSYRPQRHCCSARSPFERVGHKLACIVSRLDLIKLPIGQHRW